MFDSSNAKKPSDLCVGDVVDAFSIEGGPFKVVGIQEYDFAPLDIVNLRDSRGCVINVSSMRWEAPYSLVDGPIGRFEGYDEECLESGRKLLQQTV